MKVKKSQGKYHMYSSIYKIKLDLDDIKSIELLKEARNLLPTGKVRTHFNEVLRKLEMRYDECAQSYAQIANNTKNLHLSFYHSEMVEQVVQCQKYCQDKQKLEIIFTNEKGKELNLICSPLEQTYIKRKICLKIRKKMRESFVFKELCLTLHRFKIEAPLCDGY